jgi:hypothetical protein
MSNAYTEQHGAQCREASVVGEANTSKQNRLEQPRVIAASDLVVQHETVRGIHEL